MGPKSITVGFAITHPFWGNPYISHSWPISFDIAWRCPSGATTRAWPPRALSVPCGRMPSRSWRRSLTLGTPQILVIHYAWEPPTFWDIGVRSICDVYHICFLIMGCNGMYGSFLKWWYIIYVYINIYIPLNPPFLWRLFQFFGHPFWATPFMETSTWENSGNNDE